MGLFSRDTAAEPLDSAFAAVVIGTSDSDRATATALTTRNQAVIKDLLEHGEEVVCLARHGTALMDDLYLLVVTNRRTLQMNKKGIIQKQLRHTDVVETWIGDSAKRGLIVRIYSEASRLDYAQDDPARMAEIIQCAVGTPRVAQAICAAVDSHLSR
ncbi:MAG TPA: hypothetical protein VIJ51_16675 [Solirubrobacteraceae bacterium]